MYVIEIPFLSMWEDAMLTGGKTCTTRSKRYGQAGDRFQAFSAEFELVEVYQKTLGDVAHGLWREEGCFSPQEFKDIWTKIHPRRKWQSLDRKWVHVFRRVKRLSERFAALQPVVVDAFQAGTSVYALATKQGISVLDVERLIRHHLRKVAR